MKVWVLGILMLGIGEGLACAQGAGSSGSPGAQASVLAEPKVYRWEEMPARRMPNGAESRDSLNGLLASGEAVSVHETVQPVGAAPNPQHVIRHSEIITVVQGTVAFEHGAATEKVGAGGVIYVATGTLHTLRNIGDGPAKYVVVAIGGDIRK